MALTEKKMAVFFFFFFFFNFLDGFQRRNRPVGFFVASHVANDVGQRHDVVLGQRQRFDFAQLALHLDVRDHGAQLLKKKPTTTKNENMLEIGRHGT